MTLSFGRLDISAILWDPCGQACALARRTLRTPKRGVKRICRARRGWDRPMCSHQPGKMRRGCETPHQGRLHIRRSTVRAQAPTPPEPWRRPGRCQRRHTRSPPQAAVRRDVHCARTHRVMSALGGDWSASVLVQAEGLDWMTGDRLGAFDASGVNAAFVDCHSEMTEILVRDDAVSTPRQR